MAGDPGSVWATGILLGSEEEGHVDEIREVDKRCAKTIVLAQCTSVDRLFECCECRGKKRLDFGALHPGEVHLACQVRPKVRIGHRVRMGTILGAKCQLSIEAELVKGSEVT